MGAKRFTKRLQQLFEGSHIQLQNKRGVGDSLQLLSPSFTCTLGALTLYNWQNTYPFVDWAAGALAS
ncbi:MAG: hypothetical protein NPIRA02_12120 [Nitrospirales bacterium]|nr:MAG: hypothetical protein NPIRA02_12120 [Nitrospirales bacterium]